MHRPFRLTVAHALATVLLFAPVCSLHLSAQAIQTAPLDASNSNPVDLSNPNPLYPPDISNDQNWDTATEPITARNSPWMDLRSEPPPQDPVMTSAPGTVSAEVLRHPVSRKGKSLLAKARKYSEAGDHAKAVKELKLALKEPTAAPYAHSMLGTEYLKLHQIPQAIAELQQGAAMMPKLAANHSNLGFALCQAGQIDKGLGEIEAALKIDGESTKARFLKGVILLGRGSHDNDTWENLDVAQKQIPTAHLALAIYYAQEGKDVAAEQQLEAYSDLGVGVSLPQAQTWLEVALRDKVPPAQALGLWAQSPTASQAGE